MGYRPVHSNDLSVDNDLALRCFESAREIKKSDARSPLVPRPELDASFCPNSYGSVSVQLHLVLPGRTLRSFALLTALFFANGEAGLASQPT